MQPIEATVDVGTFHNHQDMTEYTGLFLLPMFVPLKPNDQFFLSFPRVDAQPSTVRHVVLGGLGQEIWPNEGRAPVRSPFKFKVPHICSRNIMADPKYRCVCKTREHIRESSQGSHVCSRQVTTYLAQSKCPGWSWTEMNWAPPREAGLVVLEPRPGCPVWRNLPRVLLLVH